MFRISCILIILLLPLSLLAQDLKPYTVFLKPGSRLTRLSDQKSFALEKGIYVKALETNYKKRDLFRIYDEQGNALYETKAESIVEVIDDYQILPRFAGDITYPAPSQLKVMDKKISFDSQLNFHFDNLQTKEFNSVYSDSLESIVSPRLELRTIYSRPEFPVGIGGTINYQNASWRNDVDQIRLAIVSFGPTFMYRIYSDEEVTTSAYLGAEFAPVYRTTSGAPRDEYKAMLYDIGIEAVWQTGYGSWSLGSHYRSHILSLEKSSRENVSVPAGRITLSAFGLMVGFHHNWSL